MTTIQIQNTHNNCECYTKHNINLLEFNLTLWIRKIKTYIGKPIKGYLEPVKITKNHVTFINTATEKLVLGTLNSECMLKCTTHYLIAHIFNLFEPLIDYL